MHTLNHPISLHAVDQEVIVIDAALSNDQPLLDALPLGGYVHLLDDTADAITQLAEIVAHYPGLKTLHLISHGAPGAIFLGEQTLCLDTLAQHTQLLESLRQFMAPDGEWLIYGCEVAQGDTGRAFIAALQAKTGLKIAAASHKVGHTDLGGNWALDVMPAAMHSQPLALNEWRGVLNAGPELDLDGFDTPGTSYEVDYMADARPNFHDLAFFTHSIEEANSRGLTHYGELRISFNKTAFTDEHDELLKLGEVTLTWNAGATTATGSDIAFTVGGDDYLYSIAVVGDIATITFKGDGGSLTANQVEFILDNIYYTNTKQFPTGGNRIFTLNLTDSLNQNPAETTFTVLFGQQATPPTVDLNGPGNQMGGDRGHLAHHQLPNCYGCYDVHGIQHRQHS